MFDKTVFAERLRKLREEKGWTQKEASEKCGIVSSTYSAYENKKNAKIPSLDIATQIAEGYGITLNELCGMEAKPPEAPKAVEPPAEDHVYTCAEIARLLMELEKKGIVTDIVPKEPIDPSELDAGGNVIYNTCVYFNNESLYDFFTGRKLAKHLASQSHSTRFYESWEKGEMLGLENETFNDEKEVLVMHALENPLFKCPPTIPPYSPKGGNT